MRRFSLIAAGLLAVGTAAPAVAEVPVSLKGSPASMQRQNGVARDLELAFAESPAEVDALESAGDVVRLDGNADYEVADFVGWPQAQPEMRQFIERLAARYRAATRERLVVTSLIRPTSRQPGNSHALSVHPTGIAVDLRVSERQESRDWLEAALLELEREGVLDVTRERNPPHYHVALFPVEYAAHVEREMSEFRVAPSSTPSAGASLDATGRRVGSAASARSDSGRLFAASGFVVAIAVMSTLGTPLVRRLRRRVQRLR